MLLQSVINCYKSAKCCYKVLQSATKVSKVVKSVTKCNKTVKVVINCHKDAANSTVNPGQKVPAIAARCRQRQLDAGHCRQMQPTTPTPTPNLKYNQTITLTLTQTQTLTLINPKEFLSCGEQVPKT